MKRMLGIVLAGLLALAIPGVALADTASYVMGQVNTTLVAASQGHIYAGFATQQQAGAAQSGQQQVSLNHSDSLTVILPFGIVIGQSVDANGVNRQGQSSAYVMGQTGAGFALGVQSQSILQGQRQWQVSSGVGNN